MVHAYIDLSRAQVQSKRVMHPYLVPRPDGTPWPDRIEDREPRALAGYVATPEAWKAFEAEWRAALEERGIKVLHTTDCRARRGEFKDWKPDEPLPFIAKLLEIINRHVSLGFGAVVPVDDRKDRVAPYLICLQKCLEILLRNPAIPQEAQIGLFFEAGDRVGEHINTYIARLKAEHPHRRDWGWGRLGEPQFVGKEVAAIQAADLIAYEHMRHVNEHSKRGLTIEQLEGAPIESYVCDRTLFDIMLSMVGKGLFPHW